MVDPHPTYEVPSSGELVAPFVGILLLQPSEITLKDCHVTSCYSHSKPSFTMFGAETPKVYLIFDGQITTVSPSSVSCPLPTPTPSPKEANPPENSEFAMEDLGIMGFWGEHVGWYGMIRDNRQFGHECDQFDLGKPNEPSSFLRLPSRVFDMNPPSV